MFSALLAVGLCQPTFAQELEEEEAPQEDAESADPIEESEEVEDIRSADESTSEDPPAAAQLDTEELRSREVNAGQVKDFAASQRKGLDGSGRGEQNRKRGNSDENANRRAQDGRTGGGDESPQGEASAHVMDALGQGKSRGSPNDTSGNHAGAGAGGRGSDGGAIEGSLDLGKVGGRGLEKFGGAQKAPVSGGNRADGAAGGRGSDGGALDDGAGPAGAENVDVMKKVGGRQKAPITHSDQVGGRGSDGGALDGRLGNVSGGDAINKDRANSGDWAKDESDKGGKTKGGKEEPGLWGKFVNAITPPPGKPEPKGGDGGVPTCAPNCEKRTPKPYTPPPKKEGAQTGVVEELETQSLEGTGDR